jgi:hypothetical protein
MVKNYLKLGGSPSINEENLKKLQSIDLEKEEFISPEIIFCNCKS